MVNRDRHVTAITHTGPSGTLMSFAYTYDAAGNRTSVTKDGGNPESYTLDALNRLTNVTNADGATQAYTYDVLPRKENRLSLAVNGGTPITYTYNDADQLRAAAGYTVCGTPSRRRAGASWARAGVKVGSRGASGSAQALNSRMMPSGSRK